MKAAQMLKYSKDIHVEINDAQPNKKLFIPGGTGGFGAMAIPIAKSMGLLVITSGSERGRLRTSTGLS